MTSTLLVSVLMSVYNGENYLNEAMDSILNQTFADFEFIIINDGSTDRTNEILTEYASNDSRIIFASNVSNFGLIKSLNKGLRLSKGKYIARQDADDISHPTRLEQQVSFLESRPDIVLLGTQASYIDENKKPLSDTIRPLTHLAIQWFSIFGSAFVHTSVMFRREVVWSQLQGYDECYVHVEDAELWSRIVQKYGVRNLSTTLVDHRVHPESITATNRDTIARTREKIYLNTLRQLLRTHDVPTEWPALLNSLRTGRFEYPSRQMAVIDALYTNFCALHPEAAVDRYIQRHLANQFGKIAYGSAAHNRAVSLRSYVRACRIDISIIQRVPIQKYFALWIGGEFIRQVYRHIKNLWC